MRVVPLGDQAVLAYLPDEAAAVALAAAVRAENPPWLHDVVPAYATVGVFFDADAICAAEVMEWIRASGGSVAVRPPSVAGLCEAGATPPGVRPSSFAGRHIPSHPAQQTAGLTEASHNLVTIPVCYEMQLDAVRVCGHTGLAFDDVVRLHTSFAFTVHAIGFVPGFPYLGYLPPELCGVGRLPSPRTRVEPGSVGLTARQTGVYPLPRPGGWNLIGRTPLTIVDVATGFFPLRVGDAVRFERIDERRFRELDGERLSPGIGPG